MALKRALPLPVGPGRYGALGQSFIGVGLVHAAPILQQVVDHMGLQLRFSYGQAFQASMHY